MIRLATDSTGGYTPLHNAVFNKHYNRIKTLLDKGESPTARNLLDDTPLHLTLSSNSYILGVRQETFIDERLFLLDENPFGSNGFSHCHIACMIGKLDIVRSFLDRGVDPNLHRTRGTKPTFFGYEWHGNTCLHVATHAGRSDVVQLLLERGARPNARNTSLNTPLHNAFYDCHGRATKLLLKHDGVDVNARNCDGMTPLHMQCLNSYGGSIDVMKALIESGADVNLVHRFGVSILKDIILRGPADCAQYMVKHVISLEEAGLDVSKENLKSLFEFEGFKNMTGYRKLCRYVLECMNRVRLDAKTTLSDALRVRDPRRLQRLAVNEKFVNRKFHIYGYLVRLQYRRGKRIAEAVLALQKLYAFIAKADNGLPQECAEMVVYHLTYEDMWRVIQAASQ